MPEFENDQAVSFYNHEEARTLFGYISSMVDEDGFYTVETEDGCFFDVNEKDLIQ